jgi:hypothetical protein
MKRLRQGLGKIAMMLLIPLLFMGILSCRKFSAPLETADVSGTLDVTPSPANQYFRIRYELRNGMGFDQRAMPVEIRKQLEGLGKSIRPKGTLKFVSYWALLKDGSFRTLDIINKPNEAMLGYAQLETVFASAHPGQQYYTWDPKGTLYVGRLKPGTRSLDPQTTLGYRLVHAKADVPEIKLKKDDVFIGLIDPRNPENQESLYIYVVDRIKKVGQ